MSTEAHSTSHDWQFVHRQLQTLAHRRAVLDGEEARWLREAERIQIWCELGHPTMLSYMEHTLGYGPRAALERLRVARALSSLPALEHALSTGAMSYSAAREITRIASPATEEEWLIAAGAKNLREVEEMVRGHLPGDLPDDRARPEFEPRIVRFELSPETFALQRQVRVMMQDECGQSLDDDAFIAALCRRAMEAPGNEPSRALHQIAITVCDGCGRGWQDGAGAVVDLDEQAVEQAFCDAEQIGSLDADAPQRASRDISRATRTLVWRRDHGRCRVPGCRSGRNIDVHHLVMRADGGSHRACNLILCCSAHHKAVHRGLLTITGTPDKLVFTHGVTRAEKVAPTCPSTDSLLEVARRALVHTGFRKSEAQKFVEMARAHVGAEATLAELVREAFRCSNPIPN